MAKKVWIIMADQLSFRHLAFNGHLPWMSTPNLDRFAGRSWNFSRAYCSSPLCVPSRQSFYTGHNTRHHRCVCDMKVLAQPTLFHHLGDLNVPSYGIGKMDFRFDPDQFHGLAERPGDHLGAQDFAPGSNNFSSFNGHPVTTTERDVDNQCEIITSISVDCLSRPGSGLVFTSYLKPHESWDNGLWYDAPKRFFDRYDPNQIADGRAWGYAANVSCLDYYVGEGLRQAQNRQLLDETLVLFCADHGEMGGSHGRWGKLCMFEEAIRVPLLLWHKNIAPNRISQPVALIDIFPTIFDWLEIPCPPCHGTSLLQPRPENHHLFLEYLDGHFWEGHYKNWERQPISCHDATSRLNRALIQGWWKLVHDGTQSRLFNIKKDDLTDFSRIRPQIRDRLIHLLESQYPAADVFREHEFALLP